MEPLDLYLDACRTDDRAAFSERFPHPVLLLEASEDAREDWREFRTTQLTREALIARAEMPPNARRWAVVTIRKAARNPWADRISVGRARNNDLVVRDPSVSKVHAHFQFAEDGTLLVIDAGSSNGTQLGERHLKPHEAAPLAPPMALRLGGVDMVFLDAPHFYDFLRDLLKG